jgi:Rrf2 family transcriptional regulator, cysteine metabolism repressor
LERRLAAGFGRARNERISQKADCKSALRKLATRVFIALSVHNVTFRPVKLSVKSDYAARAVLGLARQYSTGAAVRAEDLAAKQSIPANYLVQILIELKSARIVRSLRGKEGGYLLARHPSEITLGNVLRAIHGQLFDTPALSDPRCPIELRDAWRNLQSALDKAADQITFQHLSEASENKAKMYYI